MSFSPKQRIGSIEKTAIGFVRFDESIQLDLDLLISYYRNRPDIKIANDKHGKGIRLMNNDGNTLFHLPAQTGKQINVLRSEFRLLDLASEINNIPNDAKHSPLKLQLINLYKQIHTKKSQEHILEEKNNTIFSEMKKNISAIEKEVGRFTQKKLDETISTAELKNAVSDPGRMTIVPERGYAIVQVDSQDQYVGTYNLSACIGLVAINENRSLVGVAHLDNGTIATYEKSLTKMLKDLQGPENDHVTLYMLGGECEKVSVMPQMEFLSKTLAKSILDFTQKFQNIYVAGVNLFKGNIREFLVKVNNREHSVLAVSPQDVHFLTESEEKLTGKQFFYSDEHAIDHSELTQMMPPVIERNLNQLLHTPIKDLSNFELQGLRNQLAKVIDKKSVKSSHKPKVQYLLQLLDANSGEHKKNSDNIIIILNEVLKEAVAKQKGENSHSFFKGKIGGSDVLKAIIKLPKDIQDELNPELMQEARKFSKNIVERNIAKETIEEKSPTPSTKK